MSYALLRPASGYHAVMGVEIPLARLAILLAGGGRAVRGLIAREPAEVSPLELLAGRERLRPLAGVARDIARDEAPKLKARLAADGWRWLTPCDPEYPADLAVTADPPLGLFVRGRLAPARRVGVVGSRRATAYGRQVARALAEELAGAGVTVVSGMARGVDAAAHEGAIAAGGQTIAVWGTGPDRVYPAEHRALADSIGESGALVTEYPPGTAPRRHHFPERNRIIAGMVDTVVVVEAAARSGALVTARLALDEGREVVAVPGSIFSDQSLGPNALLGLGARPLVTLRDLLDPMAGPIGEASRGGDEPAGLLGILPRGEALAVDEIAARAQQAVRETLVELLELELAGAVERLADGRFSRR
jgi:DNA processing protein